nr:heat shock protein 90 [Olive leaf yellowing-associated virus]
MALPRYNLTWNEGDLFRSFYGIQNVLSILGEAKYDFERQRSPSFVSYLDADFRQYDLIWLLNSKRVPFNARPLFYEYCYLYGYEKKVRKFENLVYELDSTIRDILNTRHLDDLDKELHEFSDDEKFSSLDFNIKNLYQDSYYRRQSSDRKKFIRNISICCNRVINLELETLSGNAVFPSLPVSSMKLDSSIGDILSWAFRKGRSVIDGLSFTKYHSTGEWFKNTINRIAITTNGVGLVDVINDIWSISFLGGLYSIIDFYEIDTLMEDDARVEFLKSPSVTNFLTIFFNPSIIVKSRIMSVLKDFLPIRVTSLTQLRNNPTLTDYLKIEGKFYPRLTYLDFPTIQMITSNLRLLLRAGPLSEGMHSVISSGVPAFDNNDETFVIIAAYYGLHGTSASRVEPRPDFMVLTYKGEETIFLLKFVEDYFDRIGKNHRFSIRRAYLGTLIYYVDLVYIYADLKFRSRWIHSSSYHGVSMLYTDLQRYRSNLREDSRILNYNIQPQKLRVYSNEIIHF